MNSKKAKTIRKMAKEMGRFSTEPKYEERVTKKLKYVMGVDGKPSVEEVPRVTVFNLNKIYYRNMKKAYVNGELAV